MTSKNMKHLGISLTKDVQDIHIKNYTVLLGKRTDTQK